MSALSDRLPLDEATFQRYSGLSLPRHVSYPMPTWWRTLTAGGPAGAAGPSDARTLRALSQPGRDLSLYLHLPFCEALCTFCACNKTVLRRDVREGQGRVERYLSALMTELEWRAADVGRGRVVRQLHWGGGTPTYLDLDQIARLHRRTLELFTLAPDAEVSLEVDPRVTTREQLALLRELGFNRVSMGVQDFDARVQEHVRRVQPYEQVAALVRDARELGFASVNFDLIYGLPYQTRATVADTLARALALSPDRVAYYHYAAIPDKIAAQRGLAHDACPSSLEKLRVFLDGVATFEAAGYEFIGLDHFARPDEGLAQAKRDGTLTRNFQGMTTGAPLDLVGLGCSAISVFPGRAFLQNEHVHDAYAESIEAGREPARRGLALTAEDAERQALLTRLYGDARIDAARHVAAFPGAPFTQRFAGELAKLRELQADGLVSVADDGSFALTWPLGRVLMRNVAAVFDAYLVPDAYKAGQPETFSASA
ncbi:MAG: oxygen-independent coproporphyrinogen III oxidase [Planctomycetota bacterium]